MLDNAYETLVKFYLLRTCVPGNSSFALLIIIFVQEERRSSAIVSPPLPIMWPDTLLGGNDMVKFHIYILDATIQLWFLESALFSPRIKERITIFRRELLNSRRENDNSRLSFP